MFKIAISTVVFLRCGYNDVILLSTVLSILHNYLLMKLEPELVSNILDLELIFVLNIKLELGTELTSKIFMVLY